LAPVMVALPSGPGGGTARCAWALLACCSWWWRRPG